MIVMIDAVLATRAVDVWEENLDYGSKGRPAD